MSIFNQQQKRLAIINESIIHTHYTSTVYLYISQLLCAKHLKTNRFTEKNKKIYKLPTKKEHFLICCLAMLHIVNACVCVYVWCHSSFKLYTNFLNKNILIGDNESANRTATNSGNSSLLPTARHLYSNIQQSMAWSL